MTPTMNVSLVLILAVLSATPARGQHADHDHDHDDHKHAPAATTQSAAAKWATGGAHDDHAGHDHGKEHDHDKAHGHADEVKLTAEGMRVAKIRVEPVKKRTLAAAFTAPARVAFNAEAMAHVGSLVTGRVVEIKARVGDAVKKGDELLVVESTELGQAQSDYLRERTSLAVAIAAVEPVKQVYERAKKLYDQNQGLALAEVQKREAELKAAEGSSLTAKADAVAALNRLLLLGMTKEDTNQLEDDGVLNPRLSIRAPLDGRVIEREVTLGELVSPEKERLIVLANTDPVWVLADVPEARLAQVTPDSPAHVQVAAIPNERFEGKVTHVAPALNPDTRAGAARIELPNPDGTLKPGMFASVVLTSGVKGGEPVLAVPDEAVQVVEGTPSVFVPVEGEPNTFARRTVKVAKPIGAMVPVLSGLKEGEPVVVSGTFILKAELGKGEASHSH